MDRKIVYPGAIPLDTDVLSAARSPMIAMGFALRAMLGTGMWVDGLVVTPNTPASLGVVVGQGSVIGLETVDPVAYGSLGADADVLVKMGINTQPTNLAMAAPASAGQSVNYLIEATFLESDGAPVVLPYYNAANPAQPYLGPGNAGTAQNTVRTQVASLQVKAGTPATTGSQTTPSGDVGWVPLAVVTIANGQTQVTAGNIVVPATAPYLDPALIGRGIQTGRFLGRQVLTGAGTYVPSSGLVRQIIVTVQGGGGAGGGSQVTTSAQVAIGGAGSGGSFGSALFTTGFAGGVSYSAGVAGAGASGGGGAAGGATTFAGLATAPGGIGGGVGLGVAAPQVASAAAPPAAASFSGAARVFYASAGWGGDSSVAAGLANAVGGGGGGSPHGSGGAPAPAPASGFNATGYGGGGSASAVGLNTVANTAGGNGSPGVIFVDEYS